ncbi:CoA-binding protein [Oceanomicrobium pacificus]|uniref:CoA-binding protein n=1 Tax=Oceanomicrobium pacificus TaxID=2692916 RepID=A0A6B0U5D2_9RHOB|nr:CoA-binding protein [Oceanomicrobium pacificus]MXU66131.1 CoA-binding protein [Oceanomicrobium pacificus]
MPLTLDADIRDLLERTRTIAIVGASPNPARPAHRVMAYLQAAGYHVIPVNPGQAGSEILGAPAYASLSDIPEGTTVDMVDIFRRSEAVAGIVEEALDTAGSLGISSIWMQLGIGDAAAAARAEAAGLHTVSDRCTKIEHARLIGRMA